MMWIINVFMRIIGFGLWGSATADCFFDISADKIKIKLLMAIFLVVGSHSGMYLEDRKNTKA